ncbi:pentapeptide repeat-containing protein [Amycolatopsis tolypomycina]|uniref:pentapeptide repeat-containing protein n=1 Tax=Amycolatopsis tolypomycina TaxID=208445 RepID=UPI0033AD22E4
MWGTRLERVLRTRTIVLWGAGLLVVAAVAATALLTLLGRGRPEDSARLDALKTSANIVIGAGGAAALLLAARRQRSAELDLVRKDHDATERRVTEINGKAADQLGSDKAPVRLAGLYALERPAAGYAEHRQTIVNVLRAYLRMPYRHNRKSAEELQVRKTAQRILLLHLRPGSAEQPNEAFWPDVDLDFSGARLVGLTLTHCSIRSITCYDGEFSNWPRFAAPNSAPRLFKGRADFRGTVFGGERESFNGAVFAGPADFGGKSAARLAGARARRGFPRWADGGPTESSHLSAHRHSAREVNRR